MHVSLSAYLHLHSQHMFCERKPAMFCMKFWIFANWSNSGQIWTNSNHQSCKISDYWLDSDFLEWHFALFQSFRVNLEHEMAGFRLFKIPPLVSLNHKIVITSIENKERASFIQFSQRSTLSIWPSFRNYALRKHVKIMLRELDWMLIEASVVCVFSHSSSQNVSNICSWTALYGSSKY